MKDNLKKRITSHLKEDIAEEKKEIKREKSRMAHDVKDIKRIEKKKPRKRK
jgi:hypothetical protein